MATYMAHLRYYAGDPLEEILEKDLLAVAEACGVTISFERIDNRTPTDGRMREETLGKPIENISQDVITVVAEGEREFRKAVAAVYEKYRSPRTPYGFWGSSPEGQRIAKAVADETGGGW
jgi:hypothetical protein